MEKKHIETFIKKYHLNGQIEEVRWTTSGKSLKTLALSSDKKLLVEVEFTDFDGYGDAVIGILNTTKLSKLLSPVSEKIGMVLVKDVDNPENPDRVVNLLIADEAIEAQYQISEPDSIKKVPSTKTLPSEYEAEVKLTDAFVDRFIKAKSALPDCQIITLVMSKKRNRMEMVLGYGSNNNNNRISLALDSPDGKDKVTRPISFSALAFKEILSANEVKDVVLKISEKGLAAIEFSKDGFNSSYYLVEVNTED